VGLTEPAPESGGAFAFLMICNGFFTELIARQPTYGGLVSKKLRICGVHEIMSNAFQVAADRAVASYAENEWPRLTLSEQCRAIYDELHKLDAEFLRRDQALKQPELLAAD
jgi:hypothetical protein